MPIEIGTVIYCQLDRKQDIHQLDDFVLDSGFITVGKHRIDVPNVRLDAIIGAGANGVVFSGADTLLQRPVAVKIWRHKVGKGTSRALAETQKLASFTHPLIVRLYSYQAIDGWAVAVMELVSGVTLRSWLSTANPSFANRYNAWRLISLAVQSAHSRGIYHGDLHARNVLMFDDSSGEFQAMHGGGLSMGLKLTDFGASGFGRSSSDVSDRERRVLQELASEMFAPEQPSDVLIDIQDQSPETVLEALDQFAEYLFALRKAEAARDEQLLRMALFQMSNCVGDAPFFDLEAICDALAARDVTDEYIDIFIRYVGAAIRMKLEGGEVRVEAASLNEVTSAYETWRAEYTRLALDAEA